MKSRRKISKESSKKLFTATAKNTNYRNLYTSPMRGGYRL
jgi:hypothetical protein